VSVAVLGGREPPPGGGGGGDAPPAGAAVPGRPRAAVHPPTARRPPGEGEGPPIGDGADPQAGGGGGVRCLLPRIGSSRKMGVETGDGSEGRGLRLRFSRPMEFLRITLPFLFFFSSSSGGCWLLAPVLMRAKGLDPCGRVGHVGLRVWVRKLTAGSG